MRYNADLSIMHKTHELRLAKRMARLGTETAFEVLVKAKALEAQGRDIIHLEIGEPDFDTPGNIIEAGCDALRKGFTHYGPSAGMTELREVIAQHVSETRRVNVTPDEVVVVPGGKPIIFFSILALAEDGDEIIYPNPGFPIYESMINYVGAKAVPIRLREELEFRLDVDELASLINDRTKLLILNSPQNPTGGVLTKEDIAAIARAIGDRNIMVLSDEIYSQLIFEGEHHSIMSIDGMKERTHFARRLFQNLRDDWLADGLRRYARRSGDAHLAVNDKFELVHRQLHTSRRHRSAARFAGNRWTRCAPNSKNGAT